MYLYNFPSTIHNIGLFTNRPLKQGEAIGIIFIRVNTTGNFKNDFKENLYGRFTNHSDTPNAVTVLREKDIILQATQPINAGEEITVNYKQMIEQFGNDESLIKMIQFW